MSSSIMLMIRTTGLFTLLVGLSSASSVQVPAAVSNFQYSPSATQIFITWSVSNTSNPPDYYIIRYSLLQKRACPSPEPNVIQHETIINTTNNEFVLIGLEAYSTYSIAFVAVNDAGEGEAVERTILTRHGTPPAVTGLRFDTSITDPTSIGFIWDALTCRNTNGIFGYSFAVIYEGGVKTTFSSGSRASPSGRKYIDYIDQSSVLFNDLKPCTMYELLLSTAINTASPDTYPMYVSGDASRASGLTGLTSPPTVTGLRVDTSITDSTSIGFIWDALTCRNTDGVFGYFYARLYEGGVKTTFSSGSRASPSGMKYIDYIDQSSVLFDDLQPCTMYELLLTASINTAPPGATHPVYVSGDVSRASGLTGLTLSKLRVDASSSRDNSMVVRWSVPAPCSVSYYTLEYQLIEYLACPGDPIPEAPVSTLNVTGSYNILSELEPSSSYRVSIIGINGARNTPVVVTGTTSESAPSALSSVSYTAEANTLRFTWDALPCEDLHGELDGYEYNLYNTLTRSYVGSSRETTRATRLTFDGLNACLDYRFRVRVVLLSGHRSDWTTLMTRTPPAITGLRVDTSITNATSIGFIWDSLTCRNTDGVFGYYYARLYEVGVNTNWSSTARASPSVTKYIDYIDQSSVSFDDLQPCTMYTLVLTASINTTSPGATLPVYVSGDVSQSSGLTGLTSPPVVTGLRVDTSITEPTSIGFIWDALTCSNTGGVFGYYYARIYERGQVHGSPSFRNYIDSIDQSSVLFDGLQPCTMYELLLTVAINTAPPGATYPVYVSGDASRAYGLTGLTC